jgi:hypothetical protein
MVMCSISGCDRPARARGWCMFHYHRHYHGRPMDAPIQPKTPYGGRPCSVDGCAEPVRTNGFCERHYTRYRRHGDPTVTKRPPRLVGSEHPSWKGDLAGYNAAHNRCRRVLADPGCCQDSGPHKGRLEWALDYTRAAGRVLVEPGTGRLYSLEPDDYIRLCSACHKRYDLRRAA